MYRNFDPAYVQQNEKRVFELSAKAAAQGHIEAQHNLGEW